jgi:hypothetical protein
MTSRCARRKQAIDLSDVLEPMFELAYVGTSEYDRAVASPFEHKVRNRTCDDVCGNVTPDRPAKILSPELDERSSDLGERPNFKGNSIVAVEPSAMRLALTSRSFPRNPGGCLPDSMVA